MNATLQVRSELTSSTTDERSLQKVSILAMLALQVVTLGFYAPAWFLMRREKLNGLHSTTKLGTNARSRQ